MPTIHLENCTRCMKCVKDCPASAINIKAGHIATTCIHCGHCVAICPESTIAPDSGEITPLTPSVISPEDFQHFIAGMRSIRYYLKKELSNETIQLLIDNMKHYASASNARPINITVIQSQEKIQTLNDSTVDTLIRTMKLVTSPFIAPFLWLFTSFKNQSGIKRYKESFIKKQKTNSSMVVHHAPALMLFHGRYSKYDMSETDAYIWASNTAIYAKTLGLGSCYIGFIVKAMERNKSLRKEMNIPSNHKVYAALTLGYPKVTYINETSRKSPHVTFVR